jgi:hypothetical protein
VTIGVGAQATLVGSTVIQNANSSLTIDGGIFSTASLTNTGGGTFTFNSGTLTVDAGLFRSLAHVILQVSQGKLLVHPTKA